MPVPRVLLLYGDDEFALSQRVRSICESEDPEGMNTSRLDMRAGDEEALNNAINAMPFLAKRRLVVLTGISARYRTPSTRAPFLALLENAPETARILLVEEISAKEASKHWLVTWAKKHGVKIETFLLPPAWKADSWIRRIREEVKKQGGDIEPRAAARLAEMVGTNSRYAAQEIDKLLTYVNRERPITLEDVDTLSADAAEGSIFALVDALGEGNGKKAQAMLHRLLEEQNPFSIFGMVVRQFRLLLLAREVMESGGGVADIRQAIGGPDFVARKINEQARHFSIESLEAIYHHLLNMDEEAKTSQTSLNLALDMFVLRLTGGR